MKNEPTAAAKTRDLITVTTEFIRECRDMSQEDFEKALADAKQDSIQKNAGCQCVWPATVKKEGK